MRFDETELDYLTARQLGPDEQGNRNPAKALWQAVVVLAVIEALGRRSVSGGAAAKAEAAHNAQQWIFDEVDFEEVCDLADMDASWIRRQVRKVLAIGRAQRDEQRPVAPSVNRYTNHHLHQQAGAAP